MPSSVVKSTSRWKKGHPSQVRITPGRTKATTAVTTT